MRFRILLVDSRIDEKFCKGKCFFFDIRDDCSGGITKGIECSCQPYWVFKWPSEFCNHKFMTCSWGYGYSPRAVEFYFLDFIFVINIFIQIKYHYRHFCQLVSAECKLDWMACGSVKTVSKKGKKNFFSLDWGFLVSKRLQCGSFFSNWNFSTIVLLILNYIKVLVSFPLVAWFGLVDFGFW